MILIPFNISITGESKALKNLLKVIVINSLTKSPCTLLIGSVEAVGKFYIQKWKYKSPRPIQINFTLHDTWQELHPHSAMLCQRLNLLVTLKEISLWKTNTFWEDQKYSPPPKKNPNAVERCGQNAPLPSATQWMPTNVKSFPKGVDFVKQFSKMTDFRTYSEWEKKVHDMTSNSYCATQLPE